MNDTKLKNFEEKKPLNLRFQTWLKLFELLNFMMSFTMDINMKQNLITIVFLLFVVLTNVDFDGAMNVIPFSVDLDGTAFFAMVFMFVHSFWPL